MNRWLSSAILLVSVGSVAQAPADDYVWKPDIHGGTVARRGITLKPSVNWAQGRTVAKSVRNGQHYTVTFSDGKTVDYFGYQSGQVFVLEITGPLVATSVNVGPLPGRIVPTPYCTVDIRYDSATDSFCSAYFDWTFSRGASMAGNLISVAYAPAVAVNERLFLAIHDTYDWVLPHVPNPASPYRQLAADSLAVDVWQYGSGAFAATQKNVESLAAAGVKNAFILNHVWQNAGYDAKLPTGVVPAATHLGGDAALLSLIAKCKKLGYVHCLHENYTDAYPDAPGFTNDWASLDSERVFKLALSGQTA